MDSRKLARALRESRCWVCGERLGAIRAYVIGPMCAINRTSAEPPSHRACAEYAARACPFLTTPGRPRRKRGLPDDLVEPAGKAILRNPAVAGVWITKGTRTKPDLNGGLLFDIGEPLEALWLSEGRPATRAEVLASIESGLPLLREAAEAQDDPRALRALERMTRAAMAYLPPERQERLEPHNRGEIDLADELELREFGPLRRVPS